MAHNHFRFESACCMCKNTTISLLNPDGACVQTFAHNHLFFNWHIMCAQTQSTPFQICMAHAWHLLTTNRLCHDCPHPQRRYRIHFWNFIKLRRSSLEIPWNSVHEINKIQFWNWVCMKPRRLSLEIVHPWNRVFFHVCEAFGSLVDDEMRILYSVVATTCAVWMLIADCWLLMQVDNPMQIMHQSEAKSFLHSGKFDRYYE